MPAWVYWVIGGQAILIIVLLISAKRRKEELLTLEKQYHSVLKSTQDSHNKTIKDIFSSVGELEAIYKKIASAQKERNEVRTLLVSEREELRRTKLERFRMKNAPLEVFFAEDGMPVYWKPDPQKPYGDYTVYVNHHSGIYHVDRSCSSYQSKEDHIFNVVDYTRPCKKCAEGFFDFTTVPDWFEPNSPKAPPVDFDDSRPIMINWRD